MRTSLGEFTAHLLAESGAVVEPADAGLEVLLPAEVARVLEIPEHANLSFLAEGGGGISVSYDSEILKKMAGLLSERGQFATVGFAPPSVRLEKLEDRLGDKLAFHNAVFQIERIEEKPVSYLLGYAKYSAISDDRQEGIAGALINELNLSVQKAPLDLLDVLADRVAPETQAERQDSEKVLKAVWQAQQKIVLESLAEFLASMERRMNRDIRRVHEYYHTMIHEHRQTLAKKVAEQEDKERIESRIEAVERERKGKVQDLLGKFSVDLQLEPIAFIRIETLSPIFWLSVKRRKEARQFPVTYNPVLKSLDPLPCEACFYPRKGYY
ncbi:MAG: hypothetical protein ACREPG_12150, partial [Candidatus Binatia bacterium]